MYLLSIGKQQSQAALWKRLRTNSKAGTSRKDMIRVLRHVGFRVRVWPHMTKAQLLQEIAAQPILVRYHEEAGPDEHYAIAIGATKRDIVLRDPWTGPRHVIPWNIFLPLWQKPTRMKESRGWALRAIPR